MGLEALSRGARFVGLVEKDKKAAQALIQIRPKIFERLLSAGCEKEPKLKIVNAALDLRTCNSLLDDSGQAHAVIFFFDPPYNEFLPLLQNFLQVIKRFLESRTTSQKNILIFQLTTTQRLVSKQLSRRSVFLQASRSG